MQAATKRSANPSSEFSYSSFGAEEGEAERLIILAHGGGVNNTYMHKMATLLAEQIPQARIECPNAPHKAGTILQRATSHLMHQFSRSSGLSGAKYKWIDTSRDHQKAYNDLQSFVPRYNAFIDSRRDALGLQDKDVALMGFSQGAAVSLAAAWQRANPLACVVSHSMFVPEQFESASNSVKTKQPILFLYGNRDEVFPQILFERSLGIAQANATALEVSVIEGLTHKTSRESRKIAADYMVQRLG